MVLPTPTSTPTPPPVIVTALKSRSGSTVDYHSDCSSEDVLSRVNSLDSEMMLFEGNDDDDDDHCLAVYDIPLHHITSHHITSPIITSCHHPLLKPSPAISGETETMLNRRLHAQRILQGQIDRYKTNTDRALQQLSKTVSNNHSNNSNNHNHNSNNNNHYHTSSEAKDGDDLETDGRGEGGESTWCQYFRGVLATLPVFRHTLPRWV